MADSEPVTLEPVRGKSRGAGRHGAREVALQVLYAIDLGSREMQDEPVPSEGIFERIAENFVVPESSIAFARELVSAVVERTGDLDALLGAHAKNWRVTRMAAVDRNVLRIAVYELRDTDTPVAVVIDEAIDLARRFGSEPSPAFVNGVLDAVAREVRGA